ncbi:MAG: hypothetical protein D3904_00430 [Candidatus Electrothrix sp. EH2]|nr:hypothetical protein [Candidatus Electrothrix sp. EH2]
MYFSPVFRTTVRKALTFIFSHCLASIEYRTMIIILSASVFPTSAVFAEPPNPVNHYAKNITTHSKR